MSRLAYYIEDATNDCADIPIGVSKVFLIYAYDTGDIFPFYGDQYAAYLCRVFCVFDSGGFETMLKMDLFYDVIQEYEERLRLDYAYVCEVRVDEVRALPVLERGKTPTGPCRSKPIKPPRKREKGETREAYHEALIEYAMELDRTNPIVC